MAPVTGYQRPTDLGDALALLAESARVVLAGGTDLYPATEAPALEGDVLDITGIAALRGLTEDESGWRIGALTRWAEIAAAPLPPAFDALREAAREVGSIQIQNAGTIAGNLCNASAAADGVPALLILEAQVELVSARGARRVTLGEFITGPRTTCLRPDELLTAVLIPRRAAAGASRFAKLGARRYLVISIAMAAARLVVHDGRVAEAAIAIGACSPVARRLELLEARLIGAPVAEAAERIADPDVAALLDPMDDVRGSAGYRVRAAAELIRRAIADLAGAKR